jgi:hypothetical protein
MGVKVYFFKLNKYTYYTINQQLKKSMKKRVYSFELLLMTEWCKLR